MNHVRLKKDYAQLQHMKLSMILIVLSHVISLNCVCTVCSLCSLEAHQRTIVVIIVTAHKP